MDLDVQLPFSGRNGRPNPTLSLNLEVHLVKLHLLHPERGSWILFGSAVSTIYTLELDLVLLHLWYKGDVWLDRLAPLIGSAVSSLLLFDLFVAIK